MEAIHTVNLAMRFEYALVDRTINSEDATTFGSTLSEKLQKKSMDVLIEVCLATSNNRRKDVSMEPAASIAYSKQSGLAPFTRYTAHGVTHLLRCHVVDDSGWRWTQ